MPAVDIRELRINRGLSIAEAARQIGIKSSTYGRAEAGESRPRPRVAFLIAEFYGFQATDLWPLQDPDDEPVAA